MSVPIPPIPGRDRCATDQPPGYYRFRLRRGAPFQAVRILHDGEFWQMLRNGEPVRLSGQRDPLDIPFVRLWGPFHAITQAEYEEILAAYQAAEPGTPLASPDEPVNLRGSKPL